MIVTGWVRSKNGQIGQRMDNIIHVKYNVLKYTIQLSKGTPQIATACAHNTPGWPECPSIDIF